MPDSNSKELYFFFRKSCLLLQQRFAELVDLTQIPDVFLHGNPHVDNFAKTHHGEAMIDFDRSRIGPYSWDLVRLACSLSLRRASPDDAFLEKHTIETLSQAYRSGFENPHQEGLLPEVLAGIVPQPAEQSTRAYLEGNLNWAKKMRENPVFVSHPSIQALVGLYFKARKESDLVKRYTVREAGTALGSFGKMRILMVLQEIEKPQNDLIFIEIKEVYQDPDTESFFNPFLHHGLRMIEASYLYAPHFEKGLSFLNWRNKQYWARQIPPFKAKFHGNLTNTQLEKLAHVVGVQIGKAHRKSLRECSPERLLGHFADTFPEILEVGAKLNEELKALWREQQENPTTKTYSLLKAQGQ